MSDFKDWSQQAQQRIESALDSLLPTPQTAPQRLHAAMRYSVMNGGKRVRALLAYAAAELCRAAPERADVAATAVELIHAYSLVHDDMPCMDDDDLRRGKPACHKQYDEATALLVGDALQSLAFELLARSQNSTNPAVQLQMVRLLASASGSRGMAGGQAIDLESVGQVLSQSELEHMHTHKTGALIRAAVLLGAYCAGTPEQDKISVLEQYAQSIGLAFQVVDDILDAEADTATLGKTAGKDADDNKPTYVTILGLPRAKALAQDLHANAVRQLASCGVSARRLIQLAEFITQRHF